jgi:hypothetical protein
MELIPLDIFTKNIFENDDFILVEDPKHNEEYFHYTIWCLLDIENILYINDNFVKELKLFIKEVKKLNLFKNEKMYFTFKPTHNRIHLHIVPNDYISYRPLNELYDYENIDLIFENIKTINYINNQIKISTHLDLSFNVGVIKLENIKHIEKIENIKYKNNLDYIVVIRKKHNDTFIEHLINNYKYINHHIFVDECFNNYEIMIKTNKFLNL